MENSPFNSNPQPHNHEMLSCMCTQAMLESDVFEDWCVKIKYNNDPHRMHRKIWEWCYIANGFFERCLLKEGSRGLGFAVGQEPLPSLFASYGCKIVATDLEKEEAIKKGWVQGQQHASALDDLNKAQICPDDIFHDNVSFQVVDMNNIPANLNGFNFIWSSCALEHLGSLELGKKFIYESMRCLMPGGLAIHTTEFNCSSNEKTIEAGSSVLYRQKDLEEIGAALRVQGHKIKFDFTRGDKPLDLIVDKPPYSPKGHIKLDIEGYECTSFGLIIQKAPMGIEQIQYDNLQKELDTIRKERNVIFNELKMVLNSRSYKITEPLRKIARAGRKFRNYLKK